LTKLVHVIKYYYITIGILCLLAARPQTQSRQITGRITDPGGYPIPAATILIKGTSKGTSSDFDGSFHIRAPQKGALVVKAIGYKTKVVKIGMDSVLTVQLDRASL
jgi:TonB-dependent starch-binding outer membrane protein SusC